MTQRNDTKGAPWEDASGRAPRVRVNLTQQGSGKWVTDRTVDFPEIDPLDPTSAAMIQDTLDALDQVVRSHVATLYRLDSEDLERYLAERERRDPGGYVPFNHRRAS